MATMPPTPITRPRRTTAMTLSAVAVCLTIVVCAGHRGAQALREENRLRAQATATSDLGNTIDNTVFARFAGVARHLATDQEIIDVASRKSPVDNSATLTALDAIQRALGISLAYVLDREGTVVACTPYGAGETLTGKNYAFRPYFMEGMVGRDCIYPALGVTTNVRGLYFSSPVYGETRDKVVGVVLLKVGFETIDELLTREKDPIALASQDGIILASNRNDWLYCAAKPLSPQTREALIRGKQFAAQPLTDLSVPLEGHQVSLQNQAYSRMEHPIALTGWRIITLQRAKSYYPLTSSQVWVLGTGMGLVAFLLIVAVLLVVNVVRRRTAEKVIRQTNETLEARVIERTQELATANQELTREVTERRLAEEKVRDSERRLADIIEFLPDPTFVIDSAGRVTAWNLAMEQLTGIKARDMVGKSDYEYAVPFYGDRRPVMINHALAQNEALLRDYPGYEKRGDTYLTEVDTPALPSGPATVQVAAKRLYDQQGNVVGAIESVRDITDRKRAEAALHRAKEAAEAATRAKSEFLANMSHEIRTPMTAILGFSDMLAEGCVRECEFGRTCFSDQISTIQRNGDHLLQIINDILDLSRVEAGHLTVERIRCSTTTIVEEVRSLMAPRAAARRLTFDVEFDGPIPDAIETDPTRMRQVLVNLVGNAIKFTEQGGVRLVTRLVQASPTENPGCGTDGNPGPCLQFSVIDTGIGLTPEQVSLLFRPFTQADASTTRKYGGTGLGLAISKRLAAALGGSLEVESVVGQGSTFRVTIPTGSLDHTRLVHIERRDTAESSPANPALVAGKEPLKCRILLAEDGPSNRVLITQMLKKAGAEVACVGNGQLAVEAAIEAKAAGQPFDVILMDMQMPVLDGYGAAGRLRQQGYNEPIIALTAYAMAEDRAKCINAGCNDYVTKPISRPKLISMIRGCLRPSATVSKGSPATTCT